MSKATTLLPLDGREKHVSSQSRCTGRFIGFQLVSAEFQDCRINAMETVRMFSFQFNIDGASWRAIRLAP